MLVFIAPLRPMRKDTKTDMAKSSSKRQGEEIEEQEDDEETTEETSEDEEWEEDDKEGEGEEDNEESESEDDEDNSEDAEDDEEESETEDDTEDDETEEDDPEAEDDTEEDDESDTEESEDEEDDSSTDEDDWGDDDEESNEESEEDSSEDDEDWPDEDDEDEEPEPAPRRSSARVPQKTKPVVKTSQPIPSRKERTNKPTMRKPDPTPVRRGPGRPPGSANKTVPTSSKTNTVTKAPTSTEVKVSAKGYQTLGEMLKPTAREKKNPEMVEKVNLYNAWADSETRGQYEFFTLTKKNVRELFSQAPAIIETLGTMGASGGGIRRSLYSLAEALCNELQIPLPKWVNSANMSSAKAPAAKPVGHPKTKVQDEDTEEEEAPARSTKTKPSSPSTSEASTLSSREQAELQVVAEHLGKLLWPRIVKAMKAAFTE